MEHFVLFRLVWFQKGKKEALFIQKETSANKFREMVTSIDIKLSWYERLSQTLHTGLQYTYNECLEFRNISYDISFIEIV